MSTKITRHCDICEAEGALPFTLVVGQELDSSGDMDDITDTVDLCHRHAVEGAQLAATWVHDYSDRKRLLTVIRGLK